jgi:predicted small metal-binding protein
MKRKYIDCREHAEAGKKNCTLALSADTTEELVEAAVQHGVKVHGFKDSPSLRKELAAAIKEGSPAE